MKKNETFIGGQYHAEGIGRVEVFAVVEGSWTMVWARESDKGPGWNEKKKTFTGVKSSRGWKRGENDGYGQEHKVHIKDLKKIKK